MFVLGGERAAVRLGAPSVLTGDFPALVYAPTLQSVDAVLVSVAPGGGAGAAVDVVVDPTGLATVTGVAGQRSGGFQLAHPLFCALDLAGDSRAARPWSSGTLRWESNVSGEVPLLDGGDGAIGRLVRTAERLFLQPEFAPAALVGGLAVMIRVGTATGPPSMSTPSSCR